MYTFVHYILSYIRTILTYRHSKDTLFLHEILFLVYNQNTALKETALVYVRWLNYSDTRDRGDTDAKANSLSFIPSRIISIPTR